MDINTILNDFLISDDLHKLTRDIGIYLNCSLMVIDNAFKVIAHYSPAGFKDIVFDGSLKRGEVTYEVISLFNWNPNTSQVGEIYMGIQNSPYNRRFSALISADTRVGYLICVDIENKLHNIEKENFRYIESILAKQLFSESNRNALHFTTAEDILTHLLDGKFTDRAIFDLQSSSTFLYDFKPERFALINLSLYHSLDFFDNSLKNELKYLFYASHPFVYRDDVVLFLDKKHEISKFTELADRFHLRIVISDDLNDLFDMPKLYKKVREVMDYSIAHTSESFVVQSENFNELLMLKRLNERYNMISPKIIALHEHDKKYRTQYCLTLYMYLICHHSLKDTCERLYTHRNTVLYRIRKLKEEFVSDMEEPDKMLYYLLSLSQVLLEEGREDLFIHGVDFIKKQNQ